MNQPFDHQEFELLLQELRESNPDMQENEILELASMVSHVGSMPEIEPPNNLFGKIAKQIEIEDSKVKTGLENESRVTEQTSLLNALVINISRHMVPFSSGAVAMLVLVILFDGPIQESESEFYENQAHSVQINSTKQAHSVQINSTKQDTSSPVVMTMAAASPEQFTNSPEPSSLSNNMTILEDNSEKSKRNVEVSLRGARGFEQKVFNAPASEIGNTILAPTKNAVVTTLAKPQMKSSKQSVEPVKKTSPKSKKALKSRSKQSSRSFSRGSVRSGLMASLESRKDDWVADKSNSNLNFQAKKFDRETAAATAYGRMSDVYGMGSDNFLVDSEQDSAELEADRTKSNTKVLELRWKIPLRNLIRAREIIDSFDPEANHIRHLNMSNIEDYSEISGKVISDTYLVKTNLVRLIELMKQSVGVGVFEVANSGDSKTPINLKKFISSQAGQAKDYIWETQLIIIVSG